MTTLNRRLRNRPALLAAGYTDSEILRDRRAGHLENLRPGAYLVGAESDPVERHKMLVQAQVPRLTGTPVVSHPSAAASWGMDLWGVDLRPLYVTRAGVASRSRPTLVTHRDVLSDEEIIERDGLLLTSPARTVIDCARTLRFESAVVLADSALRLNLVTAEELLAALDAQIGMPGLRAARRIVRFADGRSKSVGESRSRVMIAAFGLPEPDLQYEVYDSTGRKVATVDFFWEKQRTVGEFDGFGKYIDYLAPGQTPGDVVFKEKCREDVLRELGNGVVRWIWDDLDAQRKTAGRIARALGVELRF